MQTPALLALEDGTLWRGIAFGARGERTGEVVFNTSLTGYQEVLTDPSYYQQIVVMTASHIGNTGVNDDDDESARTWLAGFAIREASLRVSNWRANASLDEYLCVRAVVSISEIDTRALVRHLRSQGAMRGALSSVNTDPARLIEMARTSPSMNGADLVRYVTCAETYLWDQSTHALWYPLSNFHAERPTSNLHVVVFDYGIKRNTLRSLTTRGCRVTVVPANFSARETLELKPDGVLLANGPGDPAAVTYAIETTRDLLGRVPIMGICLGHQILGLALGGDTYKLKFGHRGGNQPVKNLLTGQVEITSHNHGFAVRADSLPGDVEVTHINLNDQCVEGLRSRQQRAFSVQFHPEAAPGPHDAMNLFDEFIESMEESRQSSVASRQ
ncbi:MAG: glutamine-hydrolyzing carbamoyl-phosphate synthase small subunit [Chloroflexi bacterium]|nr:glutamine-hydrolyzing carbamoyl-phosphate synthase small subunit [Chloroflexota bacterium]